MYLISFRIMRQGLRLTFLGMHIISIVKPLLSGHPLESARGHIYTKYGKQISGN